MRKFIAAIFTSLMLISLVSCGGGGEGNNNNGNKMMDNGVVSDARDMTDDFFEGGEITDRATSDGMGNGGVNSTMPGGMGNGGANSTMPGDAANGIGERIVR